MQTTIPTQTGLEGFLAAFRHLAAALGSAEPAWLSAQRGEAIDRFRDAGFPTTQLEDWRYTNVSPIAQTPFLSGTDSAPRAITMPKLWDGPTAARLVFINGLFSAELSSLALGPDGAFIGSLRGLLSDSKATDALRVYMGRTVQSASHAFAALNSALWQDGACIIVPPGTVLTEPIHILHLMQASEEPVACHPRALIVCERGAQASIVETHLSIGDGVGFGNSLTEVVAGEGAVLNLYKSVHVNARSFHIGLLNVIATRDAQISAFAASLGGDLVRNETHVVLDAEGADCTLNGLYTARGTQHVDNHTTIDHARPHCSSRQFYNGILDGHATGVFNGRVIVRPDAQKTDAVQKNRNLLLSADAAIDSKPQLEISANDVRCTHGATVGQMDAEALFFLRSRGLDRESAVSMLVQAFASEILDKVTIPSYRLWLETEMAGNFLSRSVGKGK